MITLGRPGSVAPATDNPGGSSLARYQTDGARSPRCGSLARIGRPDFVRDPPITHELLPRVSPPKPRSSSSANLSSSAAQGPGLGREGPRDSGLGGGGLLQADTRNPKTEIVVHSSS